MEKINFKYENNKNIKNALIRAIRENDHTQSQIAEMLDMPKQSFFQFLNKKHINCDDIKKILDVVGYDLVLEFRPKENASIKNKLAEYQ